MKLNDASQANGVLEFWVDGTLDAQRSGLDFAGSYDAFGINALLLDVLGLYENLRPHVSLKLVDDNPVIQGEPTRLRQVFHNLLQNAIDAQADSATPAYDIAVEIRGSELALSIGDRGSGFPEDMIRRAFEHTATFQRMRRRPTTTSAVSQLPLCAPS